MKTSYKLLTLALVSASVTGCADLDTVYLGDEVTTSQKEQVLESDPGKALASVTGCFAAFMTNGFDSSDKHYDFGYTSLMIGMDAQGIDVPCKYFGYNWYAYGFEDFGESNDTGTPTSMAWGYMYPQIYTCNSLLSTIPADTESDELKFYRSQGLALRAFDYWVLVQLYQYNYTVNPQAPAVPLITDENQDEAAVNGCARATVGEVYEHILADLNEAITLLGESGIDPAQLIDSKPKRMITLATAYGLRARVYMTMHKYAEAAADAQAAITNFAGAPYSIDQVSQPTFTSIDDRSWMWGVAVAETDRLVTSGIVNYPAMMGPFTYGYCTVGAWRWINRSLWESIPTSDVRKGWWLDANFESPNLSAQQSAYLNDFIAATYPTVDDETSALMPYTQVKFDSYQGVMGQSTSASDIPLMRIEEMYLTLAEATGMSAGVASGATILTNFVKTYRDPKYSCTVTDPSEFQDECWRQRRIELWGEGLSWFDIMRLGKPVNRVGGAFPQDVVFNLQPDSKNLIYCLPLSEINANKMLTTDDNNPKADRPTPVQDIY